MQVEPGYEYLAVVLQKALDQSQSGKGRVRHANDRPFMEQPLMSISRMTGVGGPVYQVCKKAQESVGMVTRGQHVAAKAELLGAIIYAAAAYMLVDEMSGAQD